MKTYPKKNILITGGAGFLGSHLCKRLLREGNRIICLDNLITGSKNNISELKSNSDFEFVNHDIIEPYYRDGIDEIYNLACPASPIHYQINPIKTVKSCTLGVINMLGLAKKNNAKILQASTSEVYGDPEIHPQDENYRGSVNIIGIRSCYDEGKRCAETLFFDYFRQHQVNIRIIRIFNTYGPKMSLYDGRVISNFIIQALKGENITIYGDGIQSRSFCYVDDLIEGMVKLMNLINGFTGPVNIGNPVESSILELANEIIELTNSNSKIIHLPLPQDDPFQRQPVINLAKKELDWVPSVNLKDGLLKTIKHIKSII